MRKTHKKTHWTLMQRQFSGCHEGFLGCDHTAKTDRHAEERRKGVYVVKCLWLWASVSYLLASSPLQQQQEASMTGREKEQERGTEMERRSRVNNKQQGSLAEQKAAAEDC